MTSRETRSIAALLGYVFCSRAAMFGVATILGKVVFDMTDSELHLGLLGLAQFAPAMVFVLVSGTLADRFDRRRLGEIGMVAEGGVMVAMAWYVGTEPTAVGPIYLLVIAAGTARAFSNPALRALPADMVTPERLPWLIPRQSATFQISIVFGPVLAGFLYVADPRLPFVAAAVLLVLSAVLVGAIRPLVTHVRRVPASAGAGPPTSLVHEALEGLRFLRGEPILLGVISLDLFAVLFGGAVALLPAIAEDRLGVGAVGLGWLRAAIGIGAGLVTIFLAVRPITRRVGMSMLFAIGAFGVGTVVLGLTTNYVIAFVALAALSGADAVSIFIRSALTPLITPRRMRGRVLAVEAVFIGASNELGAFESGVTGQLLGPATAVVVGGLATIGIATAWWWYFPSLRRVDRFPIAAAS